MAKKKRRGGQCKTPQNKEIKSLNGSLASEKLLITFFSIFECERSHALHGAVVAIVFLMGRSSSDVMSEGTWVANKLGPPSWLHT